MLLLYHTIILCNATIFHRSTNFIKYVFEGSNLKSFVKVVTVVVVEPFYKLARWSPFFGRKRMRSSVQRPYNASLLCEIPQT